MLIVDVLALVLVPPFPPGGNPVTNARSPSASSTVPRLPAPHVVWGPPIEATGLVITAEPSITSTLLTMWIVGGCCCSPSWSCAAAALARLADFGTSLSGRTSPRELRDIARGRARAALHPHLRLGFFILILVCNWAAHPDRGPDRVPARADERRQHHHRPRARGFFTVPVEGFRRLGVGGYLGKFFPFYEFKNGVSAGLIALFVGLIELMLEFVKPLTLSMRLFGNIYGGEVALGVITALTLAILPVALLGLEFMLNFVQALIFSVLTLMFIVLAIESHHHEEGEMARRPCSARARRPPDQPRPTRPPPTRPRHPGDPRHQKESDEMEHIGAGLAAMGVIGPGIGIGILAGLAAGAIGRNPDAASQIRGLAIILAAFAEGLGVLAVVVGLLAIFIK